MNRGQIKLLRELVRGVGNINTVIKLGTKRLRDVKASNLFEFAQALFKLGERIDNLAQIWEEK